MSRLFTFGCSFTTYAWPTWAAIMAYDTDFEIYNYALPGLGNFGIANRILEADLKHKFTDEDIICVMWSSWDREDRILHKDEWVGRGSFYVSPDYGKDFLKNTFNENHSLVQNSYAIHSANMMYGDKIAWQSTWSGWFGNDAGAEQFEADKKIKNLYKNALPNVFYWNVDIKKAAYGFMPDPHPEIMDHYNLLERYVYPKLNLELKKETRTTCINIAKEIYKMGPTHEAYHSALIKLIDEKFPKMRKAMEVVGPSLSENIND